MRQVAIVGVGFTDFNSVTPEVSWKELMYEAAVRAYEDAGIDPRKDVESFITCAEDFWEGFCIFDEFVPDQIGAVLRPTHTVCGDGLQGLANAFMQIKTGYFDVVVVEAHSKISDLLTFTDVVKLSFDPIYERPLVGHPYCVAGLEMREWMEATDTSEEDCAAVVCKNKRNALKNPLAEYEAKITIGDVMDSEYLFDPVKRLDISSRADGAVVIVVAESDVAKSLTDKPVWVEGIGWSSDTPWIGERSSDATYARNAAKKAYNMADITNPKKDIDLLEIDDHFSFKELQHLEALGVVKPGGGHTMLREGNLEKDGDLPTNVSGGSLGVGDLIEASGLQRVLEIVLQLREETGARQVRNARVGLAQSWRNLPHGTGAVAILTRRD